MSRSLVEEFFNGEELKSAVKKIPTRAERIVAYEQNMDRICDPKYAPWPSDGQPGDMGERVRKMMKMSPQKRAQMGYDAKMKMPDCIQTNLEKQQWLEGQGQIGG